MRAWRTSFAKSAFGMLGARENQVQITRRQVLAAMGAAATAGALGVGTVGFQWWARPPGQGLKALSDHEYAIAQSIAEAWMPRGDTPALSGADADLGAFLDEVLAHMEPLDRNGLKLLLNAIDDLCLASHGTTYHALDLGTRSALLADWIAHPNYLVRSAIQAMMVFLSVGWTTHPEVASHLRPMFPCGYGR